MQPTRFDFDVITGSSTASPHDRRQPNERKDWNIAASLRTADATPAVRANSENNGQSK